MGRRRRTPRVAVTVLGVALAAAVSACGPEVDYSVPPERPGCPGGGVRAAVAVGHVSVAGARLAWFRTTGGAVHLEATGVDQGGIFDTTVTRVLVGTPEGPPYRDAGGVLQTDPVAEARVVDRSYATVTLPAGVYWVTTSSGGYVTVSSCRRGGVTAVTEAPDPAG